VWQLTGFFDSDDRTVGEDFTLLEYFGWAFEAIGGVLLGWEALFKVSDRERMKNRIAVVTDEALAGIEWVEGKQVIRPGLTADQLKEKLPEIMEERTQTKARLGLALLLVGLLLHGLAKL
jgi:hypothetical protein